MYLAAITMGYKGSGFCFAILPYCIIYYILFIFINYLKFYTYIIYNNTNIKNINDVTYCIIINTWRF